MKITPVPSLGNAVQTDAGASIRTVKMSTNATPGYQSVSSEVSPNQKLTIPDVSQTTPVAEATAPISPEQAELAKRRRALQVKERELAEREKALSQTSGQDAIPLSRLKSEPLKVLLESGVTYDQLTEAILANQGNSEINALKAELNALKTGMDEKFSEREAQAEKQVLAEMQREASQLAERDEAFELVKATKSVPQVMELIERTYRKTGEVLDVREAMQLVEDYRLQEAQKLIELNKIKRQFMPQPQAPQQRQGMRTLTNKDTAQVPMTAKQRALAAFAGTLKRS